MAESCVFGVGDVSTLISRPELFVHKLYLNYHPAGYFCLYKHVRDRALTDISKFNATMYSELPFVAVAKGDGVEDALYPILNHQNYY